MMRVRMSFPFSTQLDLLNGGSSPSQFISGRMALFFGSCWLFVINYLFYMFGAITRYLFRFRLESGSEKAELKNNSNSGCTELAPEVIDFKDSEYDGFSDKEPSSLGFKFKPQSSEDVRGNHEESDEYSTGEETSSAANVSKYSFLSEKDFTGFVKGPEVVHFSIEESYVESEGHDWGLKDVPNTKIEDGSLLQNDFQQFYSRTENKHREEMTQDSYAEIFSGGDESEKSEAVKSIESCLSLKDMFIDLEITDSNSYCFLSGAEFCASDFEPGAAHEFEPAHLEDSCFSDVESVGFNDGFPSSSFSSSSAHNKIDSYMTEVADFSDQSSSVVNQTDGWKLLDEFVNEKYFHMEEANSTKSNEEETESMEEQQKLKELYSPDVEFTNFDNGSSVDGNQMDDSKQLDKRRYESEDFDGGGKETEAVDELEESERTHLRNPSNSDYDDEDGLESLWEHQDLIEQLRMELKKVKRTSLPTILEESESPRSVDDLKPWKMEEKLLHEDPMEELQKLYKSYREKMRKLDVLNYQKMHAIGFLHLKEPFQSIASRKTSNLRLLRRLKSDASCPSSSRLVRELQIDLETVYVGQTCLSWELLQWQYLKSRDLPESDPRGRKQYNQAAGEFQQFQVLLQRFVEDEPFQGPRVQHYVKTRCVLRNLLQVPPIKEDCWKDKMVGRSRGDDGITNRVLEEIMEESMRLFWEFLKADKDEAPVILKGLLSSQTEVQDPTDSQLLATIQAELQKKEKKLKDLLRIGNCIIKRFQKHQGDCSDQALFFSQVDLKLVSRVLRMSRVTGDQLLWCHKKLSKITFKSRKLHREPSFLLFPC